MLENMKKKKLTFQCPLSARLKMEASHIFSYFVLNLTPHERVRSSRGANVK